MGRRYRSRSSPDPTLGRLGTSTSHGWDRHQRVALSDGRSYLLTTSHLPFLTSKIVSSPFVKSPFLSNSMSAVSPGYLILASAGRYFAGSVELAAFIAAAIPITPS